MKEVLTYEERTLPVREEFAVQCFNEERGVWTRMLIDDTFATEAEAQALMKEKIDRYVNPRQQRVGGVTFEFEPYDGPVPKFRVVHRFLSKFEEVE